MYKSFEIRMAQNVLINQMPLNRVAARFLEGGTPLAEEPAVLTLIRWGLDNGIGTEPFSADHPDGDRLMAQLNAMATRWHPRDAVRFLTNPESLEDVVLTAEELAEQDTAEDAAALLIDNLSCAMMANAP